MESPVLQTDVMYKARLSYTQLKHYHKLLASKSMIEKHDNKWVITEKGRSYMTACMLAEKILEDD